MLQNSVLPYVCKFKSSSYSFCFQQQGTSLGTPSFIVTDPDIGDTKTYTVDCPEFVMNSSSTEVTYSVDYDLDVVGTASSVTCITTVTDTDGEFDTALLQISISEVNDYAPAFKLSSYTLYGSAYNSIGDVIGTTNASDGDIGVFGRFLINPLWTIA